MNSTPKLEEALSRVGMRPSKTKLQVFNILSDSNEPLTSVEIVNRTDGSHFVSVYRALDALVKAGVLKIVSIAHKQKYELSDTFYPHHHHVTCEECGLSVSIQHEQIEQMAEDVTRQAGMRPLRHSFEAYGVCNRH